MFQQSPCLFLLAEEAKWQIALSSDGRLKIPTYTSVPLNHKMHLFTLSWHLGRLPQRGENGREKEREREGKKEQRRSMWRKRQAEQKAKNQQEGQKCWRLLTKYENFSFDVPDPLWSTSTRTNSILSCADLPVRHTSLGTKRHNEESVHKNTMWIRITCRQKMACNFDLMEILITTDCRGEKFDCGC